MATQKKKEVAKKERKTVRKGRKPGPSSSHARCSFFAHLYTPSPHGARKAHKKPEISAVNKCRAVHFITVQRKLIPPAFRLQGFPETQTCSRLLPTILDNHLVVLCAFGPRDMSSPLLPSGTPLSGYKYSSRTSEPSLLFQQFCHDGINRFRSCHVRVLPRLLSEHEHNIMATRTTSLQWDYAPFDE